MACHEIAALRLGLMNVLGIDDPAEKQHEEAELGEAAQAPGPLRALCGSQDLGGLRRFYQGALAGLEERLAHTREDDPQLAYLRTLMVMTKKTELELDHHVRALETFYRELDEMHHFVHELYPVD